jgi:creatinine amidohydrolase
MKIHDANWMQVENFLKRDDRAVLPIGSTEQHAGLSLMVDSILAERVSAEAAEPLGVPVFPPLSYGITPYFMGFPGTVSLRVETLIHVVRDVLDSLYAHGFRRFALINGHGGNQPVQSYAVEWVAAHPDSRVKFHNWWNAPKTWAAVKAIDPVASHASWMENFPWTRVPGFPQPTQQKPMVDLERMRLMNPKEVRAHIGDGNFGGYYERSDEDMLRIWNVAVEETRTLIDGGW